MILNDRSEKNLQGVHPDLVAIVRRAVELYDETFIVTEGLRTIERQRQLVAKGASKTMNSRHIKAANGFGHAVDLAVTLDGELRWDWPLYKRLADIVKQAAADVGVPIEWGGDWRTFKDGPHFQLPWATYPGT
jgi:peptidoglycan L-alanyl-D-glutamate endopeptidase CwlK